MPSKAKTAYRYRDTSTGRFVPADKAALMDKRDVVREKRK
jgi:hypothetical protein